MEIEYPVSSLLLLLFLYLNIKCNDWSIGRRATLYQRDDNRRIERERVSFYRDNIVIAEIFSRYWKRRTKEVVRIRRKSIGNTVKAKRGRFLGVFHRDTIARQRSLFVAFGGQRKNYVD